MRCFHEYLEEKSLPKVEEISTDDLPDILYNFFSKVKKKNIDESDQKDKGNYKNTMLRCIEVP